MLLKVCYFYVKLNKTELRNPLMEFSERKKDPFQEGSQKKTLTLKKLNSQNHRESYRV